MIDLPVTESFKNLHGLYSPLQFISIEKLPEEEESKNANKPYQFDKFYLNAVTPAFDQQSETNSVEAEWVVGLITYLLLMNCDTLSSSAITVLTPYRNQKKLLEKKLKENQAEIGDVVVFTTDEYQGKENEVVILSLVLTGPSPSPHLRDDKRLCVLTSRARRCLFFVGKFSTFYNCPEWKPIFDVIWPQQQQQQQQPRGPYLHIQNEEKKLEVICSLPSLRAVLKKEKERKNQDEGIDQLGEVLKGVKLKE
eukprot:CAMPEP_0201514546 /NCGR_PEP_ID=MMETSP0161_2-20130828/6356_1 /ASSEMBLY_ACC=CAM_ASM_000251 /TAXON_ID=180227 /ORGANISM="Neoparamoeba aestuarina, Strain SoJaBio B1-5/56/2" /LENGTH=251 /DNA_ID=CAMNT_0047911133 /DNA_START=347 /DNA_END=1102 /DNA_ORIENTATION=+